MHKYKFPVFPITNYLSCERKVCDCYCSWETFQWIEFQLRRTARKLQILIAIQQIWRWKKNLWISITNANNTVTYIYIYIHTHSFKMDARGKRKLLRKVNETQMTFFLFLADRHTVKREPPFRWFVWMKIVKEKGV